MSSRHARLLFWYVVFLAQSETSSAPENGEVLFQSKKYHCHRTVVSEGLMCTRLSGNETNGVPACTFVVRQNCSAQNVDMVDYCNILLSNEINECISKMVNTLCHLKV